MRISAFLHYARKKVINSYFLFLEIFPKFNEDFYSVPAGNRLILNGSGYLIFSFSLNKCTSFGKVLLESKS